MTATAEERCLWALAQLFADDGEILASPMGPEPQKAARLCRRFLNPDLMLSDGVAHLIDGAGAIEGPMNYARVFETLWNGKRHVLMGASQLDRFGNQNISCIGPHPQPKVQLLGVRGAPGNTMNHRTSYWVPKHSTRVFVDTVDVVSGVGTNHAEALGPANRRFFDLYRVVTNLGVLDFGGPQKSLRLVQIQGETDLAFVHEQTGFELVVSDQLAVMPDPPAEILHWLRREA
ncbi:MAG: CoA-transferase [Myxococcales bacterium]|nr:CoA-transferase [Myxococcales bacterium]